MTPGEEVSKSTGGSMLRDRQAPLTPDNETQLPSITLFRLYYDTPEAAETPGLMSSPLYCFRQRAPSFTPDLPGHQQVGHA